MGGNLLFRNALVVIQFVVSIVLMIGTVIIYRQLTFLKDRNPGFEKANLLYVPMKGDMWNKQQAFKDRLKQNQLTSDFTIITDLPTNLGAWSTDANLGRGRITPLAGSCPRAGGRREFFACIQGTLIGWPKFFRCVQD